MSFAIGTPVPFLVATDYKMANGATTRAGMWFKKMGGVTGSSSTGTVQTLTADFVRILNLSFFLPAAGGFAGLYGLVGLYWSSTPYSTPGYAYYLTFNNTSAGINNVSLTAPSYCWQIQ